MYVDIMSYDRLEETGAAEESGVNWKELSDHWPRSEAGHYVFSNILSFQHILTKFGTFVPR